MDKTEQDRIKRQLNYYLAKNIEALKSKFYGEDGIWSKYQKFIDRFKFESKEIKVKKLCTNTDGNNGWEKLNLDTYCLGKGDRNPNHNENGYGTLSWWVEYYLDDLGGIKGSPAKKYGIYCNSSGSFMNRKNELSEDVAKSYFEKETLPCLINKLSGQTTAVEDCCPEAIVLNKIYYLFKMNSENSHLIHIYKEESINRILEQLEGKRPTQNGAIDQNNTDDCSKSNTWSRKSSTIYEKINKLLDEGNKSKLGIDNSPVSVENNLFISYCFSCFCWDVLENQGGLSNKIDVLISRGDKNIILTGAPGTGKTFACKNYAREQVGNFISDIPENSEKRKTLSELLKSVSEMLKTVDGCNQSSSLSPDYFIKTVQFHPGYDYSDFIEGLRPKRVGDSNTIIYDRKDGIFKEFCKKVVLFNKQVAEFNKTGNNEKIPLDSSKFFFIIDEINRGEVSKIFGEAFSMIETGKRAPVDSNSEAVTNKVDTQYSSLIEDKKDDPFQHGFYIPENVYILATMNEIDRSLEAMDFAFRRRFSWLTVEVQDTLNEIIVNSVLDACTNSVSKNMSAIEYSFNELNDLIKKNLGPDYMLGGSYLTSLKNSSRTSVKALKEELWNNHLEPIIKDYIKGTEDNIEDYRSKFVDSNVGSINDDSKKEPLNVKQ